MSTFTDTSEKGFQKYIVKELVEQNKFRESVSNDFDKEFCINPKQLWEFIKETQPETYEMIQRKGERPFLVRLDEKIQKLGIIEVLRKGVKHFDKTVELFYRQPSSNYNTKDTYKIPSQYFFGYTGVGLQFRQCQPIRFNHIFKRLTNHYLRTKKPVKRTNRSQRHTPIPKRPRTKRKDIQLCPLHGAFCS
jgi:hypothetical protein